MKFSKSLITAVLVTVFCLTGCGTNDKKSKEKENPYDSEIEELVSNKSRVSNPQLETGELEELVSGNTGFAIDLYKNISDNPGNLFFSPISISIALSMTYAGAQGETARQMKEALHFTLGQERLHRAFNYLDFELADRETNPGMDAKEGFKLRVTNSIWGQAGEDFVPEFLDTLAENYGAGMNLLDFIADPEYCRETINGWVAFETEDRIKDLLPQGSVTVDTRLVLTNAIYFKAAWNEPFEPGYTSSGDFHLSGGSTVSAQMMHKVQRLNYAEGEGFAAAELPYEGHKISMVVIVPENLENFEETLSVEKLEQITGSLQDYLLTLSLPKFSFETPLQLDSVLEQMGMPIAFTPDADFTGIRERGGLMISQVHHKAFVKVNEEGTEAAAATAVGVSVISMPEEATLTVDRPFIFLIRDRITGTILFMGRVTNPNEE